jgi:hypothetical protein
VNSQTKKRRGKSSVRRRTFEQLRLQAEILCDECESHKQDVILNRMMGIILDEVRPRRLNHETRKALADHFNDCLYDRGTEAIVELGGSFERNMLHLAGSFDIGDLSKRIVWTGERRGETIDAR